MNKFYLITFSFAVFVGALPGCNPITPTTFPKTDNPEITTPEQFDQLATAVDDMNGKRVKIAGQSIRTEEIDEGLFVTARWLPFPSDDLHFSETPPSQTPSSQQSKKRRFTFLYPGAKNVDPSLTWQGNKFILLGDLKGKKSIPVTLSGKSAFVPHFVANCVRVWKTGGSEVPNSPDTEFTAYPPLARTFCVN